MGILGFRIYYEDGSTYDSHGADLLGSWLKAPSNGVQIVAIHLRDGAHTLNHGWDFYWIAGDGGTFVFPADNLDGSAPMKRMRRHSGLIYILPDDDPRLKRSGRTMPDPAFEALMKRAHTEPWI